MFRDYRGGCLCSDHYRQVTLHYLHMYVRMCVLVLYLEVLARLKSSLMLMTYIRTYTYCSIYVYIQGGRKYIHM